jgi:hypothetical protein
MLNIITVLDIVPDIRFLISPLKPSGNHMYHVL